MSLEALLKHPALWRGRQQHSSGKESLSTGHSKLDAVLPSHGWPIGALTEIMTASEGIGELSLLMPALQTLTRQQQWIALVAPPYIPYAPALTAAGIALDRILIVDAELNNNSSTSNNNSNKQQDDFWATEQLLRSGIFSAVILWTVRSSNDRQQRRLQLAAEQGKAWAVCYRPEHAVKNASPASLRMSLRHHRQHLQVDIIKNRGGKLHTLELPKPNTQTNESLEVNNDTQITSIISATRSHKPGL